MGGAGRGQTAECFQRVTQPGSRRQNFWLDLQGAVVVVVFEKSLVEGFADNRWMYWQKLERGVTLLFF